MALATNDGVDLYYETLGEGGSVVFLADLGCGPWLWSWQVSALAGGFEVIVPALRGTDGSDTPDEYSIASMTDDLETVLADHGVRKATVVGAGFGGMVALAYAREYTRADRLVLLGTAAEGRRFDASAFLGDAAALDGVLSGEFRAGLTGAVERITRWRREEDAPGEAKRAEAAAIEGFDASGWLHEITLPAFVAHGTADAVVSPEAGETLAEGLPRGEFEPFVDGSHLFFVERARLVNDALVGFLESGRGEGRA